MNADTYLSQISESTINIISEKTRLEGKILLEDVSRVHGTLVGEIIAPARSKLILAETAVVEGSVQADTLIIDGFVQGDITATTKVHLSGTGRVIGNIKTPSLIIDFGAYFEGRSLMDAPLIAQLPELNSPSPA